MEYAPLSDEQLYAILGGCEGVTPGPYRVRTHPANDTMFFVEAPPHVTKDGVRAAYGIELLGEDTGDSFYPMEQKRRDAAHVARLDPVTVAGMAIMALSSADAAAALKRLMLAYVSLMETGRHRIIDLGGSCDPVDVMEAGDPALIEARAALAALKEKR